MTTALKKYSKLEGPGLWSGAVADQRRDVIVSFGEATLVISDSRSLHVLSHWSLAAVERLNPGAHPALFSPDGGAEEVLELDDTLLIEALEEVRAALITQPGWFERLRLPVMLALSAAALGLGALLLPPALVDHTAAIVPMAKRAEIGERILADLQQSGAQLCQGAQGAAALAMLSRVLFDVPVRVVVMRDLPAAPPRIQPLPGAVLLVDAGVLYLADNVDSLAGALVMARLHAQAQDPLRPLLYHVGVITTFRLLTTGSLRPGAARGYARIALSRPLPDLSGGDLAAAFHGRVGLLAALQANAALHDPALTEMLATLAPAARPDTPTAALTDGQWVSLQNICDS
ncbi:MAG: hypothetical protein JJT99_05010 [Rhodobacteraceae bacterium]|nr:hypothetical protein [Paracoccaceae bacterium]